MVAGVGSGALVEALARVPRERFLGPPPWYISSGISLRSSNYQSTTDVRDLYHDVLVALRADRALNNGQPSLIAKFIDTLSLAPGKRVFHLGCGAGYYTAILAEIVGSEGSVAAVEIDPGLAALAAANLRGYAHVNVLRGDGTAVVPGLSDAILINAGLTHPHPSWPTSLTEAGVLLLPLLVGRNTASNDAMAIRVQRCGDRFKAEPVTILTIYPSPTGRDMQLQNQLNEAFESHRFLQLQSLRTDTHDRLDSCIVHAPGFCLSSRLVESPAGNMS